jgi:hypothetical protein
VIIVAGVECIGGMHALYGSWFFAICLGCTPIAFNYYELGGIPDTFFSSWFL